MPSHPNTRRKASALPLMKSNESSKRSSTVKPRKSLLPPDKRNKKRVVLRTGGDLANIDKSMYGKQNMIILVYMDTCGYCQLMRPEWNEFANHSVHGNLTNVVEIDRSTILTASDASPFMNTVRRDFKGYVPFIMKMAPSGATTPYMGNRTKEDLSRFVRDRRN